MSGPTFSSVYQRRSCRHTLETSDEELLYTTKVSGFNYEDAVDSLYW